MNGDIDGCELGWNQRGVDYSRVEVVNHRMYLRWVLLKTSALLIRGGSRWELDLILAEKVFKAGVVPGNVPRSPDPKFWL